MSGAKLAMTPSLRLAVTCIAMVYINMGDVQVVLGNTQKLSGQWLYQEGTSSRDMFMNTCIDPETANVFAVGWTFGSLYETNSNNNLAFIMVAYSPSGTKLWSKQIATNMHNLSTALEGTMTGCCINKSGDLLVFGFTSTSLYSGQTGTRDAFVAKYNSQSGALLASWQWGVASTNLFTYRGGTSDTANNVYAAYWTDGNVAGTNAGGYDYVLFKLSPDLSSRTWTIQGGSSGTEVFGFMDTSGNALVVDSNDEYLYGTMSTDGSMSGSNAGSTDVVVIKWRTSDGAQQWVYQTGTSSGELPCSIAIDSTALYVSGNTQGAWFGTNAGGIDGFVMSLSFSGTRRWGKQGGTSGNDVYYSVSTGYSPAENEDLVNVAGNHDTLIVVKQYDTSGDEQWSLTEGDSSASSVAYGASTDCAGNVIYAGSTTGSMSGTNAGSGDTVVRKLGAYSRCRRNGSMEWYYIATIVVVVVITIVFAFQTSAAVFVLVIYCVSKR